MNELFDFLEIGGDIDGVKNFGKLRFLTAASFEHFIYPTTVWTTIRACTDESTLDNIETLPRPSSPGTDPRNKRNEMMNQQLQDSRRIDAPAFSNDTNMISPQFHTSQSRLGSASDVFERNNMTTVGNKILIYNIIKAI